jgi:hypothetical protein
MIPHNYIKLIILKYSILSHLAVKAGSSQTFRLVRKSSKKMRKSHLVKMIGIYCPKKT